MRQATSSQGGSVLIIVLWISVGLAAIAFTFAHTSQLAYRSVDNEVAGRQAEQATEAGARYARSILSNLITPNTMPELTTYLSEAVPVGEASFWFLAGPDPVTSTTSTGTSTTPLFGLVDEASKININLAKDPADTSEAPSPVIAMLTLLPGMTEELAAAIADWRDEDDDVSDNGAESETYATRNPSYSAKNKPFESIEELGQVNGATYEILYGEDANMNGVLDPNEDDGEETPPYDNRDGKLEQGIFSYLTCFSRESNKQSDGTTARVNITATSTELSTLLTDKLGADSAQAALTAMAPFYDNDITTNPPPKSVMEFFIDSGISADDLLKIIGEISATPSTSAYIDGRINVNTASETVLACIPGIGTEKAATIVAARGQRQAADENIAWFREALADDEAAKIAGLYITGRTCVVSADVAAVGRNGRGYRRTRFVIDNSTGTGQIVYRRNLSSLGWALGAEVRQTLVQQKEVR